MKTLLALLYLSMLAIGAFGQGTITVANGTYAFARTNATGLFGGTAGNTAPTLGGFYYAVFTAASTVTSIDHNLQSLLSGIWTFTGVYATNNGIATGGRLTGGAGVATSQGWSPGQTNSYLVLGWSGNLATFDVNSVLNQLRGAQLQGGVWVGGSFGITNNYGLFDAYLGVSAIGYGEAGGGTTGLGPLPLFGTTASAAGQPIGSPFDMYVVCGPCPEPSALASVGLGVAVLLTFRRRK